MTFETAYTAVTGKAATINAPYLESENVPSAHRAEKPSISRENNIPENTP